MVLEIWIKIPLGCESPPLKKPHVLQQWVQPAMAFLCPFCFGAKSPSGLCCTTDFTLNEILGSQKYFCAWKGPLKVSCQAYGLE